MYTPEEGIVKEERNFDFIMVVIVIALILSILGNLYQFTNNGILKRKIGREQDISNINMKSVLLWHDNFCRLCDALILKDNKIVNNMLNKYKQNYAVHRDLRNTKIQ